MGIKKDTRELWGTSTKVIGIKKDTQERGERLGRLTVDTKGSGIIIPVNKVVLLLK